jgi:hypothetical protein
MCVDTNERALFKKMEFSFSWKGEDVSRTIFNGSLCRRKSTPAGFIANGGTQLTEGKRSSAKSRRVGGYTWRGLHYTPGLFEKKKKPSKTVKPNPQRGPGDERQNW